LTPLPAYRHSRIVGGDRDLLGQRPFEAVWYQCRTPTELAATSSSVHSPEFIGADAWSLQSTLLTTPKAFASRDG